MEHPYAEPFGFLSLPPMHSACRLVITIPAKDEADFLLPTLDALRQQSNPAGQPLDPTTYEVILLANNCADTTAAVARAYGRRHPALCLHVAERTFPAARAGVGTARRLLMDTARRRFLDHANPRGMIATTDADTRVDPHWTYYILAAADRGAQAVGGRIFVPTSAERAGDGHRKQHLLDVTYRSLFTCLESMLDPTEADPWPRHFQHFGPSTAVRVDAYTRCGGLPPRRSLEDVALVQALERIDVPITHDPRVRVKTSPRVSYRVGGRCFSSQLSEWAELARQDDHQRVVGLANAKRLIKWKVALRRAVARRTTAGCPRLAELCAALGLRPAHLEYRLATGASFGAVYQYYRDRLLNDHPSFAATPIQQAIADLRRFTRPFRHHAAGRRPADSARPVAT